MLPQPVSARVFFFFFFLQQLKEASEMKGARWDVEDKRRGLAGVGERTGRRVTKATKCGEGSGCSPPPRAGVGVSILSVLATAVAVAVVVIYFVGRERFSSG